MNYERLDYISGDRSLRIDFVFWDCGPSLGWRIYIINKIDYKNRNTSFHTTHRLHFTGDTYPCICWQGKISTLEQAKSVASVWGDATALYIQDGGSFDAIVRRLLKS